MDNKRMLHSAIVRQDFLEKAKNENPGADLDVFDKLKESFIHVNNTDEFKNLTESFLDIEKVLQGIQDEVVND